MWFTLNIHDASTNPPPRNARPLLEAPIRMGILWCMHCVRTALAEWEND